MRELEKPEATEVIVITGHATVDSAVAALRAGASDYLVKPADLERVQAVLRHAKKTSALQHEIGELRDELRTLGRFGRILGSSPRMQVLYDQLTPRGADLRDGHVDRRERHRQGAGGADRSRALAAPRCAFLPLNCGAVAPQLIESELFGHERGSFTGADRQHKGFFERANGGTIFLDEITEMPMELQVKLLRVLETGTVNARRRHAAHRQRRAGDLRDQPRAGEGRRRRQAARGPLSPPERIPDPPAAAARARHRHRAARAVLPRRAQRARGHAQDRSRAMRWCASTSTAGPATCAS